MDLVNIALFTLSLFDCKHQLSWGKNPKNNQFKLTHYHKNRSVSITFSFQKVLADSSDMFEQRIRDWLDLVHEVCDWEDRQEALGELVGLLEQVVEKKKIVYYVTSTSPKSGKSLKLKELIEEMTITIPFTWAELTEAQVLSQLELQAKWNHAYDMGYMSKQGLLDKLNGPEKD